MASRRSTSRKSREPATRIGGEAGLEGPGGGLDRPEGRQPDRVALAVRLEVAAGQVDVGVDQARHQRPPAEIDDGDVRVVAARFEAGRRADRLDPAVRYQQRAALVEPAVAVDQRGVQEERAHVHPRRPV